ncbi:MAG: 2-oxoglutarate dehydrogenase E1 component [Bacteroidales bacterium]|nr:2-oxoglutarate dehydrogenase E1 component [Bacteroidales bacterium]
MDSLSFLGNAEINAIESLYQQYLQDPSSVNTEWQVFFRGFEFARKNYDTTSPATSELFVKEFRVIDLINEYRRRGHFFTKTNPVRTRRKYFPTLDIENFGLNQSDLDTVFHAGKEIGIGPAPLRKIIEHLQKTYCQSVGVEYLYIRSPERVEWLKKKMESTQNTYQFSPEQKKEIFSCLVKTVGFEKFLHNRFVGQKRFSVEGTETLLPALHQLIKYGSELGIKEFVIGMPHRGRLNVLTNILEKPYHHVFREFAASRYEDENLLGDVKYHLGYDNIVSYTPGKKTNLLLVPNPSHLEAVGPVAQGIAHARIKHVYNNDYNKLCPVIIHGDAAIAAQGVVYEVIQLSELEGYGNGGTVHIVANNQVGFTTNYLEARSSIYCTDVGKVTRSPVFHVNGDDVEAVVYTIMLALEYRQTFHSDVFVDILGYRRYGHNEGDEPRFTQPVLYKIIENHPNARDIYAQRLIEEGVLNAEQVQIIQDEFNRILEDSYAESQKNRTLKIKEFLHNDFRNIAFASPDDFIMSPETGVGKDIIHRVADAILSLPPDKKFFSKTHKLLSDRRAMFQKGIVDWAMAEQLAFGSLVVEGHPVRLSGQDSMRGTFAHRHAGHVIEDTDQKYFPIKVLDNAKADFTVYNSPLSEYGVLGFEYGYALATPQGLTIWEAQFGDFHNVAQVIIDQYLSSAEEKWGLKNGLVLFLPHGFEGQGPEHSHARIERFLELSAHNNWQIVNCTTPANFFHVLRRQLKRKFRMPLVIFTPKSLLRHPKVVSSVAELEYGHFKEVIDDENVDIGEVRRLVLCSGKVYYDLLEKKEELNARDVAIVRIEQLYPFPMEQLRQIFEKYNKKLLTLWVQEEPENMGAWRYIQYQLRDILPVERVSRSASASPAVGLSAIHQLEQQEIVEKVFRLCDCSLNNKYCGLQCVEGKTYTEILHHFRLVGAKIKHSTK